MDNSYGYDVLKDKLIDDGNFERVDNCIDVMLKKAYQCGMQIGEKIIFAKLIKSGLLRVQVGEKGVSITSNSVSAPGTKLVDEGGSVAPAAEPKESGVGRG